MFLLANINQEGQLTSTAIYNNVKDSFIILKGVKFIQAFIKTIYTHDFK